MHELLVRMKPTLCTRHHQHKISSCRKDNYQIWKNHIDKLIPTLCGACCVMLHQH